MKIKNIIVGITSLSIAASASLPVLGEAVETQESTQTQMITQAPTQNITQIVSQTQTEQTTIDFTDVPKTHPNYKAIMALKKLGIIQGYKDGTFLPNREVNRVEALKFILLGAKIDVPEQQGTGGFIDTIKTEWSAKYILKARELKIIKGYSDNTFRPLNTVSLSENLIMIVNAWKLDLASLEVKTKPFADVELETWYTKIFAHAKAAGWLSGDNKNLVSPLQPMTRAKLAQLVYNALQPTPTGTPINEVKSDATVSIRDFNYVDSIVDIKVGSTVTWINKDPTIHTITSDNGTLLNSGEMGFDQEYTKTFTEIGTYKYHCEKYPFMKGTVRVNQ